jgi:hypothetical protein
MMIRFYIPEFRRPRPWRVILVYHGSYALRSQDTIISCEIGELKMAWNKLQCSGTFKFSSIMALNHGQLPPTIS